MHQVLGPGSFFEMQGSVKTVRTRATVLKLRSRDHHPSELEKKNLDDREPKGLKK